MEFPYQKQWRFLMECAAQGKIFNAYLFYGPEKIDKVAINFLKAINAPIKEIDGLASYKFIDQGNLDPRLSANLMVIEPLKEDNKGNEKKGNEILINQIREAQNFASRSAFNNGYKAVIIKQAHLLNEEAQNSFLKILEEPKGKVVFILLSDRPERLLPTVISRCAKLFFPFEDAFWDEPEEREAIKDLAMLVKAGLPQRFEYAKLLLKDLEKADGYGKMQKIFYSWAGFLRAVLLKKIGLNGAAAQANGQNSDYTLAKIVDVTQKLQEAIFLLEKTNVNPKLNLETFLLNL